MSAPSRTALLVFAAAVLAACATAAPVSGTATPLSSPAALPSPAAAPTAPPTTPPTTVPPRPRIVVLDPGHNGGNARNLAAINKQVPDGRGGTKPCNTTGTQTDAGYPEHAFAWDLARRVRDKLTAKGVTVVMTRDSDAGVGPCVDVRGAAGEKADADAVVSLHADGSAPANRGFHVAYSEPPLYPAQAGPAHVLSADLRDALRTGGFAVSDYIGRDGLSARNDLAGLNLSTRPTALVECANMRNAAEAALVSSADGRERYATAIAAGVLAFLAR
ncbi:N-acetylmuramoyl-L-alanine amidase [Pseudonocardia sp. N23]|uniref:N-acetylmuramoyl-L-alanine amidase n=1 Tax=Pseudonocardia sp. N23 TaxID=1987376 RepID=UPI000BFD4E7A|nr:N-acetylmuramoyl-L-alanine amidase [Pseudonocardia sp. N23]GAY09349.1 probable secreted protein [Pseudonocardia sp. N23]